MYSKWRNLHEVIKVDITKNGTDHHYIHASCYDVLRTDHCLCHILAKNT